MLGTGIYVKENIPSSSPTVENQINRLHLIMEKSGSSNIVMVFIKIGNTGERNYEGCNKMYC